jgi:hypothetical protein
LQTAGGACPAASRSQAGGTTERGRKLKHFDYEQIMLEASIDIRLG